MAEENPQQVAQTPKSGGLSKFVMPIAVLLGAAVVALVLFKYVLLPRLSGEPKPKEEVAEGPVELTPVEFPDFTTNVKTTNPEEASGLFIYSVTLECGSKLAAEVVGAHKSHFRDLISRLHEFKTREELNDPLFKDSVKKQVLQEANEALKEYLKHEEEVKPEDRITAVYHDKWFTYDRL